MPGVIANPALVLDQMGDPRRRPQTALVAQSLRPALQAAFDASQVFGTSKDTEIEMDLDSARFKAQKGQGGDRRS